MDRCNYTSRARQNEIWALAQRWKHRFLSSAYHYKSRFPGSVLLLKEFMCDSSKNETSCAIIFGCMFVFQLISVTKNREFICGVYSSPTNDKRIHIPGTVFRFAGYIDAINQRTNSL